MRYCVKCLFPDTKPNLGFDENGVCDACSHSEEKQKIDWKAKKEDLRKVIEKYRSKSNSNYDCVIPVSGGKDSHFQSYFLKTEFDLNPLLVSFRPRDWTELGRKNLENLKSLGFDCIEFCANPIVYKKLAKFGLEELGDVAWPEHMGIFPCAFRVAIEQHISLIVWGENPALEYGGPKKLAEKSTFDKEYDDKHGSYFQDKIKAEDMIKYGFKPSELKFYMYPPDDEIKKLGIVKIFLGSYVNWNARKQLEGVKKIGLTVLDEPNEGTFTNYENLDTKYVGLHDYFKWLKYGYGRATDHASIDIRNGLITRDEGLKLVKQYEGKIPTKYLDEFLEEFDFTDESFLKICEKFTNKNLFKTDENGNLLRDDAGNLEKLKYDN